MSSPRRPVKKQAKLPRRKKPNGESVARLSAMAEKVIAEFEDLDLTNEQRELLKLLDVANAPFRRYANDCGARTVNTDVLVKEAKKHPRLKGISEQ